MINLHTTLSAYEFQPYTRFKRWRWYCKTFSATEYVLRISDSNRITYDSFDIDHNKNNQLCTNSTTVLVIRKKQTKR